MADRSVQHTGQIENVSVVYNIYRIVLPLILLVTYITSPTGTQLGSVDPVLFVQVASGYATFGVLIVFFAPSGHAWLARQNVLAASFLVDILAITLLIYSCGGVGSGLGLLLLVTAASSAIQIRGRVSTFITAVAVLALMYEEAYLMLASENPTNQFFQTGVLGIMLFATSLYVQTLTERIYKAAALADKQASDIIDLEQLNNEILQRMRTGVVLTSQQGKIITLNSAARSILSPAAGETEVPETLEALLPPALLEQFVLWKKNSKRQPQPVLMPDTNKQVQANFAYLNPGADSDVLIFLEDNRKIVQRVRQMKLASLGRLTASIAHEIRNPLGAISHASQLLQESGSASDHDRRMIEIILNHCDRVNMIIEDVLDASRHDDTSATEINLKEWLEQFIANYKQTQQVCDEITLQVKPEEITVFAISGQLEQVLNNLFENGLRYSKQATGRATLTVEAGIETKSGDQQPYLHVIDDGPGISEDAEAQLFEPFHTTESGGTGLGLYISKELCEANQSQLVYGRTSAGKSCFSIYFSHPERHVA